MFVEMYVLFVQGVGNETRADSRHGTKGGAIYASAELSTGKKGVKMSSRIKGGESEGFGSN